MKLGEIVKILDAEVLVGTDTLDLEITAACGSDLMSDVMAYVRDNVLLLTGLLNVQVIRTAEMMDIKAVVFVRGKMPGSDMIEMAKEKGIAVLRTKEPMYISCGKLYSAGIVGKGVWE
jgi:predicted transcriptional regulator